MSFIDLAAQRDLIRTDLDAAIKRVVDHGAFILGPEVNEFEVELGKFAEVDHVVGCSNGTDALAMPLRVWGIGPGDAVFVPSFTFAATAEIVTWFGATPVFVDVDAATCNMSLASLQAAIQDVLQQGNLKPRVVIAVDLFGRLADYPRLRELCNQHGLYLVSDAAQGLGATSNGLQAGHWADVVTTSFFPAKPLGCYGDGGAVLTNNAELAEGLLSVRVHGKGKDKYDNVRIGMNARLDTLQAAVLLQKLAVFPQEIIARNRIAAQYNALLGDIVQVPELSPQEVSTWAQYTIVVHSMDRDELAERMRQSGVPTAVYYPRSLHQQTAYREFPCAPGGLPVSEALSATVLSLPMHPYLSQSDQARVVSVLRQSVLRKAA
ncbi:DegT/DnrJ/EryC1/StrS family aminotransferase [Aureimonas fodinaquatilis]|uniref:DegT/DnrJ/EryC1/StrS family aminotransferase n=1 Tax=Aureimonas fodinaquatilis TaxID=2565783 RepID=UPI00165E7817|nr:DegT/DnrJ/EryC1/StrS family aminotransferase [Aureimonas fodinaquatilis]